jgi:endoglucanase
MMSNCQAPVSPPSLSDDDWQRFKQRFISADGRVIDAAQHHVTHSEGQAYAMLLAVTFDDRASFETLWHWTREHLMVRPHDTLMAWLWREEEKRLLDFNNATDADIVVIWALHQAAKKWQEPRYRQEARRIAEDLSALLRHTVHGDVLRPGAEGFEVAKGMVLNPSYWVLPAFRELATQSEPILAWAAMDRTAMGILQQARFGHWQLPADWLLLHDDGTLQPWPDRPAEFSYDAIRIPLFLAWVGERDSLHAFVAFWRMFSMQGGFPDRVNLISDEVHIRPHFAVVDAIARLCQHAVGDQQARFPTVVWYHDINSYEAALQIFSQMAWLTLDEQERKGL